MPRLQETEVASLFTVMLERFLHSTYPHRIPGTDRFEEKEWHTGQLLDWNGRGWWAQEFMAPVWEKATLRTYRVWGMTARIMVDTARIAYGHDPEFPYNTEFGDEMIVAEMQKAGEMKPKPKKPHETTAGPELAPEKKTKGHENL